MKCFFFLTLVTIAYAVPSFKVKPLPEQFVEIINSKQSTWKAGKNLDVDSPSKLRHLAGTLKNSEKTLPVKSHEISERLLLPEFFDARLRWPNCTSIGEIRDQAACGSCWAFGAVEAMSDRICIHSNGEKQVSVSAEDLMSCCILCGYGCYGGFPDSAWSYWNKSGIVTGGLYGTKDGCKPYSIAPCAHYTDYSSRPACAGGELTPMCVSSCEVSNMSYENELTFGESVYYIPSDQQQIKLEIMLNGPVEAAFDVYEDFLYYKSGVYQHIEGEQLGGHAVKILGWGEENKTAYWLVANSYGDEWGDNGYFKILRGVNHVGIESDIVAGLPKL